MSRRHGSREHARDMRARGMTVEEVARKVGVCRSTVQRWDREENMRDKAREKDLAIRMLNSGASVYETAMSLRLYMKDVSTWNEERVRQKKERRVVYPYSTLRAAELLRQGFTPEEVSGILKLRVDIVRGLNLKKIPPIDRTRDPAAHDLPPLRLQDFTRSGLEVRT